METRIARRREREEGRERRINPDYYPPPSSFVTM